MAEKSKPGITPEMLSDEDRLRLATVLEWAINYYTIPGFSDEEAVKMSPAIGHVHRLLNQQTTEDAEQ